MPATPGSHDFVTTDSKRAYEGAILNVRVDTVVMPGGGTAQREIAEHRDGVAVVALDDSGNVVLVRQYRHPMGARMLELPAGLCDVPGESAQETGARELEEEAGLRAGQWRALLRIAPSPGFCDETVHIFLATGLSEVERPGAEHEELDMELMRVPLSEAVHMVSDGRISNAIAVAGLLAAYTAAYSSPGVWRRQSL